MPSLTYDGEVATVGVEVVRGGRQGQVGVAVTVGVGRDQHEVALVAGREEAVGDRRTEAAGAVAQRHVQQARRQLADLAGPGADEVDVAVAVEVAHLDHVQATAAGNRRGRAEAPAAQARPPRDRGRCDREHVVAPVAVHVGQIHVERHAERGRHGALEDEMRLRCGRQDILRGGLGGERGGREGDGERMQQWLHGGDPFGRRDGRESVDRGKERGRGSA